MVFVFTCFMHRRSVIYIYIYLYTPVPFPAASWVTGVVIIIFISPAIISILLVLVAVNTRTFQARFCSQIAQFYQYIYIYIYIYILYIRQKWVCISFLWKAMIYWIRVEVQPQHPKMFRLLRRITSSSLFIYIYMYIYIYMASPWLCPNENYAYMHIPRRNIYG